MTNEKKLIEKMKEEYINIGIKKITDENKKISSIFTHKKDNSFTGSFQKPTDVRKTEMKHILSFVKLVNKKMNNSEIEKITNKIIETNHCETVYQSLEGIKGIKMEKLLNYFFEISNHSFEFNYRGKILVILAKNNNLYTKDIEDFLIKVKDYKNLIAFLSQIEKADKNKIEKIIIETDNPEILVNYAKKNQTTDMLKIENRLIEIGSSNDLISFCNCVEKANKEKLKTHIIKLIEKETKEELKTKIEKIKNNDFSGNNDCNYCCEI
jgi:hypothetical protein